MLVSYITEEKRNLLETMVAKKCVKASKYDLAHVPVQAILLANSFTTKFEPAVFLVIESKGRT